MRSFVRSVFWIAVGLCILVGIARLTAIRWWHVPSDDPYLDASIAPTLAGGDLIILWRLTKPSVGDLVLCPEPGEDGSPSAGRIVIGRVVAEAEDNVRIEGGQVFVNGEKLPTESACPERQFSVEDPETQKERVQYCSLEKIGSNVHMVGKNGPDIPIPKNQSSVDVSEGEVWLASDNRFLPYDSRDYGSVELESCKETVVFRLVSALGFFDVDKRLTFIP